MVLLASLPPAMIKPPIMTLSTCLNKAAGADVRQLGSGRRINVVSLDQSHAGCVPNPAHNCGVGARRQRPDDCGLGRIGGREFVIHQHRLVSGRVLHPVVVGGDHRAGGIVQGKRRIGQDSGHTEVSQGWADRTKDNLLGVHAANNEAADEDVVAGQNIQPGGDVSEGPRRGGSSEAKDDTCEGRGVATERSRAIKHAVASLGTGSIAAACPPARERCRER